MRRAIDHWKAKGLDLSNLFHKPLIETPISHCETQDHELEKALDKVLIEKAQIALNSQTPVEIPIAVKNYNRSFGAMLSGEVAKRYGHAGLSDNTISIKATGTGGPSFGAFLAKGVSIDLAGEANDYVGKGLSGGRIAIYPPADSKSIPENNIIVGNTGLYGAISGECYFRGIGGERFAVRNSGAIAIVEGTGDHGCEYMTGGIVVVLGSTGRNFAAGMSGGIAYIFDEAGDFEKRCNKAMVQLEKISPAITSEMTSVEQAMQNMLGDDAARLKLLIQRHYQFTQSSRAKQILDNWAQSLPNFIKVMPTDYRKALEQLQSQAA